MNTLTCFFSFLNIQLLPMGILLNRVYPPGGREIFFVYFLFAFSIFVLNFVLTYEIRELRLKFKISFFNALGTYFALMTVLSPLFFVYCHNKEYPCSSSNGIIIILTAFVILYSAYVQFIYGLSKDLKNEMLDKIIVVVGNCLWLIALIIIGRTWYYAPESQGYYGGFFSMILFFYFPMVGLLLLFKMLSRSFLKIKFPNI